MCDNRYRKETSMSTPFLARRSIGRLALGLVGLLGVLVFTPHARAADDYSVSLQTPAFVRQFQNVALTAVVKDSQGQPVDGIPVTFQVAPEWRKDTAVVPNQATTSDGTASAVFHADIPGVVMVTVQVGNTTQTTHITVTGYGSRVTDKQT